MFGLSPDAVAALLGALVGAVLGAGSTLGIGFVSRAWASRDAKAASRRAFVVAVTERFQKIVKASTREEFVDLNDEMFGAAGLGVYIPRGEDSVFIWYSIRDTEVLQLGLNAAKANRDAKAEIFNASIDVLSKLRSWARGDNETRTSWFKHEVATTHKAVLDRAKGLEG